VISHRICVDDVQRLLVLGYVFTWSSTILLFRCERIDYVVLDVEAVAYLLARYHGTKSALNDNQTRATFKDREVT